MGVYAGAMEETFPFYEVKHLKCLYIENIRCYWTNNFVTENARRGNGMFGICECFPNYFSDEIILKNILLIWSWLLI